MKKRGWVFVISGPSGSGKTTLRERLLKDKELKGRVSKSVSLTTRARRPGERDKKDYVFINNSEFKRRLKAKKILEWTRYLGYYYATPADFIKEQLDTGRNIILCLDLKGALKTKQLYPKNTATIFIVPPSLDTLRERIKGRRDKAKDEEIRQRLNLARKELQAARLYDYSVVNRSLPEAIRQLREIILTHIR